MPEFKILSELGQLNELPDDQLILLQNMYDRGAWRLWEMELKHIHYSEKLEIHV